MERSNRIGWAQVRAGVFIFVAMIFIAGGVLLMGQKSKMFVSKGKLRVVMDDVAGLKEGRYDILIDGQAATSVTHLELATGWNMAVSAGPITRQACDVLALIFKKNLVGQALWEAQIHGRKAKLPGLQTQRDELEAQINATCQPKPHHFVIQPVGPS